MILGLKRGTVELYDHDPEWEIASVQTIALFKAYSVMSPLIFNTLAARSGKTILLTVLRKR